MYLHSYYKYVVRSLLVGRLPTTNTHKIGKLQAIYLRATLSKVDKDFFFFLPAFFCGLTG